MIYFTAEDDTLQRASARVFGDWTLFPVLRDYNAERFRLREIDPDSLPMNEPLEVPDIPTSDEIVSVTEGMTYEALAADRYHTEAFARFIRERAGGIAIYDLVGQEIVIPALARKQQIDAARRRLSL